MQTMPIPRVQLSVSCRNSTASKMVNTVLDLSTGTTLFTSPICKARK